MFYYCFLFSRLIKITIHPLPQQTFQHYTLMQHDEVQVLRTYVIHIYTHNAHDTQWEFLMLWYHPQFIAMLFQWSHAHYKFYHYYPFNCMIFCDFVLELVETAVCFTICMIQHVFSILSYSFSHIFIKLLWIEDKQQQHCFSIEGRIIIYIG